ncbi:MAG: phosphoglycerate kinase, partial [Candidatus Omnitrophota bacterium]
LLKQMLENSLLISTDSVEQPPLQISSEAYAKLEPKQQAVIVKRISEAQEFLTQVLGSATGLKKGKYEIERSYKVKISKTPQEECVVDARANPALLESWVCNVANKRSLKEARETAIGKEQIAAFKAVMVARANVSGIDRFFDRDKMVIIPISNESGQAHNVRVSNPWQAVADAVIHNERFFAGKSNALFRNLQVQRPGDARVSDAKMLDIAEKLGVRSALLFIGTETPEQTRTMDFLYGRQRISKFDKNKMELDFSRIVTGKMSVESKFRKVDSLMKSMGRTAAVITDAEQSQRFASFDKKMEVFGRDRAAVRVVLDPRGNWWLMKRGQGWTEAVKMDMYKPDPRNLARLVHVVDTVTNIIMTETNVKIYFSLGNLFGIDLSGIPRARIINCTWADRSSIWLKIFQGSRRVRPEDGSQHYNKVDRILLFSGAKKGETRNDLEKIFQHNQHTWDKRERYQKVMEMLLESPYKFNLALVESISKKGLKAKVKREVLRINKILQDENSLEQLQNPAGDTEASRDKIFEVTHSGMQQLRKLWSKTGDLGKKFYGKDKFVTAIIDEFLFPHRVANKPMDYLREKVWRLVENQPAYKLLTPEQISSAFFKEFSSATDYPVVAAAFKEGGYTLEGLNKGLPGIELGPVKVSEFENKYEVFAARLRDSQYQGKAEFFWGDYMVGKGAFNDIMQSIQRWTKTERETMSEFLPMLGISNAVGAGLPSHTELIKDSEAFELAESLVLSGAVDLTNYQQTDLKSLLNIAMLVLPFKGEVSFNARNPIPVEELRGVQTQMLTRPEFLVRNVKNKKVAAALKKVDARYNENIYKSEVRMEHLMNVVSVMEAGTAKKFSDVMGIVMPLGPVQIEMSRFLSQLVLPNVSKDELKKLTVFEFHSLMYDLYARGQFMKEKGFSREIRQGGSFVCEFMGTRGIVKRVKLQHFVDHPELTAFHLGVNDEEYVRSVARVIAGVLSKRKSEEYLPFNMIVEQTAPLLKGEDPYRSLRELDITPEFAFGLRFCETEEFLEGRDKVGKKEEKNFYKVLDPDIKVRLVAHNSEPFTIEDARQFLSTISGPDEINKALEELDALDSKGRNNNSDVAFYQVLKAVMPAINHIGTQAYEKGAVPLLESKFGRNWHFDWGKRKDYGVKVVAVPQGKLIGPDNIHMTTAKVFAPSEDEGHDKDNYLVKFDAVDNLMFTFDNGKFLMRLNMIGEYNFGRGAHELFHIAINSVRDDVKRIVNSTDPAAQAAARKEYTAVLDMLKVVKGGAVKSSELGISELNMNECITRFYSMVALVLFAINNEWLQATDASSTESGFIGHANKVLRKGLNVHLVVQCIYDLYKNNKAELIRLIYRDVTEEKKIVDAQEERFYKELDKKSKFIIPQTQADLEDKSIEARYMDKQPFFEAIAKEGVYTSATANSSEQKPTELIYFNNYLLENAQEKIKNFVHATALIHDGTHALSEARESQNPGYLVKQLKKFERLAGMLSDKKFKDAFAKKMKDFKGQGEDCYDNPIADLNKWIGDPSRPELRWDNVKEHLANIKARIENSRHFKTTDPVTAAFLVSLDTVMMKPVVTKSDLEALAKIPLVKSDYGVAIELFGHIAEWFYFPEAVTNPNLQSDQELSILVQGVIQYAPLRKFIEKQHQEIGLHIKEEEDILPQGLDLSNREPANQETEVLAKAASAISGEDISGRVKLAEGEVGCQMLNTNAANEEVSSPILNLNANAVNEEVEFVQVSNGGFIVDSGFRPVSSSVTEAQIEKIDKCVKKCLSRARSVMFSTIAKTLGMKEEEAIQCIEISNDDRHEPLETDSSRVYTAEYREEESEEGIRFEEVIQEGKFPLLISDVMKKKKLTRQGVQEGITAANKKNRYMIRGYYIEGDYIYKNKVFNPYINSSPVSPANEEIVASSPAENILTYFKKLFNRGMKDNVVPISRGKIRKLLKLRKLLKEAAKIEIYVTPIETQLFVEDQMGPGFNDRKLTGLLAMPVINMPNFGGHFLASGAANDEEGISSSPGIDSITSSLIPIERQKGLLGPNFYWEYHHNKERGIYDYCIGVVNLVDEINLGNKKGASLNRIGVFTLEGGYHYLCFYDLRLSTYIGRIEIIPTSRNFGTQLRIYDLIVEPVYQGKELCYLMNNILFGEILNLVKVYVVPCVARTYIYSQYGLERNEFSRELQVDCFEEKGNWSLFNDRVTPAVDRIKVYYRKLPGPANNGRDFSSPLEEMLVANLEASIGSLASRRYTKSIKIVWGGNSIIFQVAEDKIVVVFSSGEKVVVGGKFWEEVVENIVGESLELKENANISVGGRHIERLLSDIGFGRVVNKEITLFSSLSQEMVAANVLHVHLVKDRSVSSGVKKSTLNLVVMLRLVLVIKTEIRGDILDFLGEFRDKEIFKGGKPNAIMDDEVDRAVGGFSAEIGRNPELKNVVAAGEKVFEDIIRFCRRQKEKGEITNDVFCLIAGKLAKLKEDYKISVRDIINNKPTVIDNQFKRLLPVGGVTFKKAANEEITGFSSVEKEVDFDVEKTGVQAKTEEPGNTVYSSEVRAPKETDSSPVRKTQQVPIFVPPAEREQELNNNSAKGLSSPANETDGFRTDRRLPVNAVTAKRLGWVPNKVSYRGLKGNNLMAESDKNNRVQIFVMYSKNRTYIIVIEFDDYSCVSGTSPPVYVIFISEKPVAKSAYFTCLIPAVSATKYNVSLPIYLYYIRRSAKLLSSPIDAGRPSLELLVATPSTKEMLLNRLQNQPPLTFSASRIKLPLSFKYREVDPEDIERLKQFSTSKAVLPAMAVVRDSGDVVYDLRKEGDWLIFISNKIKSKPLKETILIYQYVLAIFMGENPNIAMQAAAVYGFLSGYLPKFLDFFSEEDLLAFQEIIKKNLGTLRGRYLEYFDADVKTIVKLINRVASEEFKLQKFQTCYQNKVNKTYEKVKVRTVSGEDYIASPIAGGALSVPRDIFEGIPCLRQVLRDVSSKYANYTVTLWNPQKQMGEKMYLWELVLRWINSDKWVFYDDSEKNRAEEVHKLTDDSFAEKVIGYLKGEKGRGILGYRNCEDFSAFARLMAEDHSVFIHNLAIAVKDEVSIREMSQTESLESSQMTIVLDIEWKVLMREYVWRWNLRDGEKQSNNSGLREMASSLTFELLPRRVDSILNLYNVTSPVREAVAIVLIVISGLWLVGSIKGKILRLGLFRPRSGSILRLWRIIEGGALCTQEVRLQGYPLVCGSLILLLLLLMGLYSHQQETETTGSTISSLTSAEEWLRSKLKKALNQLALLRQSSSAELLRALTEVCPPTGLISSALIEGGFVAFSPKRGSVAGVSSSAMFLRLMNRFKGYEQSSSAKQYERELRHLLQMKGYDKTYLDSLNYKKLLKMIERHLLFDNLILNIKKDLMATKDNRIQEIVDSLDRLRELIGEYSERRMVVALISQLNALFHLQGIDNKLGVAYKNFRDQVEEGFHGKVFVPQVGNVSVPAVMSVQKKKSLTKNKSMWVVSKVKSIGFSSDNCGLRVRKIIVKAKVDVILWQDILDHYLELINSEMSYGDKLIAGSEFQREWAAKVLKIEKTGSDFICGYEFGFGDFLLFTLGDELLVLPKISMVRDKRGSVFNIKLRDIFKISGEGNLSSARITDIIPARMVRYTERLYKFDAPGEIKISAPSPVAVGISSSASSASGLWRYLNINLLRRNARRLEMQRVKEALGPYFSNINTIVDICNTFIYGFKNEEDKKRLLNLIQEIVSDNRNIFSSEEIIDKLFGTIIESLPLLWVDKSDLAPAIAILEKLKDNLRNDQYREALLNVFLSCDVRKEFESFYVGREGFPNKAFIFGEQRGIYGAIGKYLAYQKADLIDTIIVCAETPKGNVIGNIIKQIAEEAQIQELYFTGEQGDTIFNQIDRSIRLLYKCVINMRDPQNSVTIYYGENEKEKSLQCCFDTVLACLPKESAIIDCGGHVFTHRTVDIVANIPVGSILTSSRRPSFIQRLGFVATESIQRLPTFKKVLQLSPDELRTLVDFSLAAYLLYPERFDLVGYYQKILNLKALYSKESSSAIIEPRKKKKIILDNVLLPPEEIAAKLGIGPDNMSEFYYLIEYIFNKSMEQLEKLAFPSIELRKVKATNERDVLALSRDIIDIASASLNDLISKIKENKLKGLLMYQEKLSLGRDHHIGSIIYSPRTGFISFFRIDCRIASNSSRFDGYGTIMLFKFVEYVKEHHGRINKISVSKSSRATRFFKTFGFVEKGSKLVVSIEKLESRLIRYLKRKVKEEKIRICSPASANDLEGKKNIILNNISLPTKELAAKLGYGVDEMPEFYRLVREIFGKGIKQLREENRPFDKEDLFAIVEKDFLIKIADAATKLKVSSNKLRRFYLSLGYAYWKQVQGKGLLRRLEKDKEITSLDDLYSQLVQSNERYRRMSKKRFENRVRVILTAVGKSIDTVFKYKGVSSDEGCSPLEKLAFVASPLVSLSEEQLARIKNKTFIVLTNVDAVSRRGDIESEERLNNIAPYIRTFLSNNNKITIVGHGKDGKVSLRAVADWFRQKGLDIGWVQPPYDVAKEGQETPQYRRMVRDQIRQLTGGTGFLVENIRSDPYEWEGDEEVRIAHIKERFFDEQGEPLVEFVIYFDIETAHREDARFVVLPKLIPAIAGPNVKGFLKGINDIRDRIFAKIDELKKEKGKASLALFCSGAKPDKIERLYELIQLFREKVDCLYAVAGGACLNYFLAAKGWDIGAATLSNPQKYLPIANDIIKSGALYIPRNLIAVEGALPKTEKEKPKILKISDGIVPAPYLVGGLDTEDIYRICTIIRRADISLMFGPLTYYENIYLRDGAMIPMQVCAHKAKQDPDSLIYLFGLNTFHAASLANVNNLGRPNFGTLTFGGSGINQVTSEQLLPAFRALEESYKIFKKELNQLISSPVTGLRSSASAETVVSRQLVGEKVFSSAVVKWTIIFIDDELPVIQPFAMGLELTLPDVLPQDYKVTEVCMATSVEEGLEKLASVTSRNILVIHDFNIKESKVVASPLADRAVLRVPSGAIPTNDADEFALYVTGKALREGRVKTFTGFSVRFNYVLVSQEEFEDIFCRYNVGFFVPVGIVILEEFVDVVADNCLIFISEQIPQDLRVPFLMEEYTRRILEGGYSYIASRAGIAAAYKKSLLAGYLRYLAGKFGDREQKDEFIKNVIKDFGKIEEVCINERFRREWSFIVTLISKVQIAVLENQVADFFGFSLDVNNRFVEGFDLPTTVEQGSSSVLRLKVSAVASSNAMLDYFFKKLKDSGSVFTDLASVEHTPADSRETGKDSQWFIFKMTDNKWLELFLRGNDIAGYGIVTWMPQNVILRLSSFEKEAGQMDYWVGIYNPRIEALKQFFRTRNKNMNIIAIPTDQIISGQQIGKRVLYSGVQRPETVASEIIRKVNYGLALADYEKAIIMKFKSVPGGHPLALAAVLYFKELKFNIVVSKETPHRECLTGEETVLLNNLLSGQQLSDMDIINLFSGRGGYKKVCSPVRISDVFIINVIAHPVISSLRLFRDFRKNPPTDTYEQIRLQQLSSLLIKENPSPLRFAKSNSTHFIRNLIKISSPATISLQGFYGKVVDIARTKDSWNKLSTGCSPPTAGSPAVSYANSPANQLSAISFQLSVFELNNINSNNNNFQGSSPGLVASPNYQAVESLEGFYNVAGGSSLHTSPIRRASFATITVNSKGSGEISVASPTAGALSLEIVVRDLCFLASPMLAGVSATKLTEGMILVTSRKAEAASPMVGWSWGSAGLSQDIVSGVNKLVSELKGILDIEELSDVVQGILDYHLQKLEYFIKFYAAIFEPLTDLVYGHLDLAEVDAAIKNKEAFISRFNQFVGEFQRIINNSDKSERFLKIEWLLHECQQQLIESLERKTEELKQTLRKDEEWINHRVREARSRIAFLLQRIEKLKKKMNKKKLTGKAGKNLIDRLRFLVGDLVEMRENLVNKISLEEINFISESLIIVAGEVKELEQRAVSASPAQQPLALMVIQYVRQIMNRQIAGSSAAKLSDHLSEQDWELYFAVTTFPELTEKIEGEDLAVINLNLGRINKKVVEVSRMMEEKTFLSTILKECNVDKYLAEIRVEKLLKESELSELDKVRNNFGTIKRILKGISIEDTRVQITGQEMKSLDILQLPYWDEDSFKQCVMGFIKDLEEKLKNIKDIWDALKKLESYNTSLGHSLFVDTERRDEVKSLLKGIIKEEIARFKKKIMGKTTNPLFIIMKGAGSRKLATHELHNLIIGIAGSMQALLDRALVDFEETLAEINKNLEHIKVFLEGISIKGKTVTVKFMWEEKMIEDSFDITKILRNIFVAGKQDISTSPVTNNGNLEVLKRVLGVASSDCGEEKNFQPKDNENSVLKEVVGIYIEKLSCIFDIFSLDLLIIMEDPAVIFVIKKLTEKLVKPQIKSIYQSLYGRDSCSPLQISHEDIVSVLLLLEYKKTEHHSDFRQEFNRLYFKFNRNNHLESLMDSIKNSQDDNIVRFKAGLYAFIRLIREEVYNRIFEDKKNIPFVKRLVSALSYYNASEKIWENIDIFSIIKQAEVSTDKKKQFVDSLLVPAVMGQLPLFILELFDIQANATATGHNERGDTFFLVFESNGTEMFVNFVESRVDVIKWDMEDYYDIDEGLGGYYSLKPRYRASEGISRKMESFLKLYPDFHYQDEGINFTALLLYRAAMVCIELGCLDKALALLNRASEIDTTSAEIPVAKGNIYSRLNDPQAALREYEEALRNRNNNPPCHKKKKTAQAVLAENCSPIEGVPEIMRLSIDRLVDLSSRLEPIESQREAKGIIEEVRKIYYQIFNDFRLPRQNEAPGYKQGKVKLYKELEEKLSKLIIIADQDRFKDGNPEIVKRHLFLWRVIIVNLYRYVKINIQIFHLIAKMKNKRIPIEKVVPFNYKDKLDGCICHLAIAMNSMDKDLSSSQGSLLEKSIKSNIRMFKRDRPIVSIVIRSVVREGSKYGLFGWIPGDVVEKREQDFTPILRVTKLFNEMESCMVEITVAKKEGDTTQLFRLVSSLKVLIEEAAQLSVILYGYVNSRDDAMNWRSLGDMLSTKIYKARQLISSCKKSGKTNRLPPSGSFPPDAAASPVDMDLWFRPISRWSAGRTMRFDEFIFILSNEGPEEDYEDYVEPGRFKILDVIWRIMKILDILAVVVCPVVLGGIVLVMAGNFIVSIFGWKLVLSFIDDIVILGALGLLKKWWKKRRERQPKTSRESREVKVEVVPPEEKMPPDWDTEPQIAKRRCRPPFIDIEAEVKDTQSSSVAGYDEGRRMSEERCERNRLSTY